MMITKVETSLCGAVDLLAAIFERDRDVLRIRYGILPKGYRRCLNCGKPTKKRDYCSPNCRREYSWVPLVCPICEKIFYREKSIILSRAKTPFLQNGKLQEHFFCSRQCLGSQVGKTVGFKAHPENGGMKRKWDYAKVYEMKKRTDWGAIRISRALGIPTSAVSHILAKEKGD